MKKKVVTIVIVLATVVLGGVAVYTAVRLYQLRQQSVAPTAPSSKPAAAEPQTNTCTQLSFNLTPPGSIPPSATPTPTPTASATPTPSASTTATPTPTPTTTAQASPSTTPSLPATGIDYPTLLGAGFGIFAIALSLILAL